MVSFIICWSFARSAWLRHATGVYLDAAVQQLAGSLIPRKRHIFAVVAGKDEIVAILGVQALHQVLGPLIQQDAQGFAAAAGGIV